MNRFILLLFLGLVALFFWERPHPEDIWQRSLIVANSRELATFATPRLKKSKTGKSFLTYNRMGFDTTTKKKNWLVKDFIAHVKRKDLASSFFLEVGSGYGNIISQFFEKAQKAKIIANDITREHLMLARSKVPVKQRSRLFLSLASFYDIAWETDVKVEAIMMHRVLHFFSGEELKSSLEKAYQLLVEGGRLYIAVNTPFNKDYSSWFLPQYEEKLKKGESWPGEHLPVAKALPAQAYALPEFLHVMDERVLVPVLEDLGFKVIKSGFISMKRFQTDSVRDGREVFAVVVEK